MMMNKYAKSTKNFKMISNYMLNKIEYMESYGLLANFYVSLY